MTPYLEGQDAQILSASFLRTINCSCPHKISGKKRTKGIWKVVTHSSPLEADKASRKFPAARVDPRAFHQLIPLNTAPTLWAVNHILILTENGSYKQTPIPDSNAHPPNRAVARSSCRDDSSNSSGFAVVRDNL